MLPQTPARIIYIVVITLAILAIIGVSSLAGTMFFKNYADPAILTAFISITSGVVGSLSTILVNTRQTSPNVTTVTTPSSPETPASIAVEPTKP